jgi:anti-sigma factor RsiW
MSGYATDPCAQCEEVMQRYLDGVLSDAEIADAHAHLERCHYCAKRYRFEERLRHFVREAAVDRMTPELRQRLAALRTPLL